MQPSECESAFGSVMVSGLVWADYISETTAKTMRRANVICAMAAAMGKPAPIKRSSGTGPIRLARTER